MKTSLIFVIFLILPFAYCLHKHELKYFLYVAVMLYWIPVVLPTKGILGSITLGEFFLYCGFVFYFIETRRFNKIRNLRLQPIIVVGLLLYGVGGLLSAANSIDDFYLFIGFRRLFILPAVVLFLSTKTFKDEATLRTTVSLMEISTIIFLLFLAIHPMTEEFSFYRGLGTSRLGGEYAFFGKYKMSAYESTLGAVIGYLCPVFLMRCYNIGKQSGKRLGPFLLFGFLVVFIVLTLGRAGWIAGGVGCLLFVVRHAIAVKRIGIKEITISTFLIFLFLTVYQHLRNLPIFEISYQRFSSIVALEKVGTLDMRILQWKWGLEVFQNNLFGIGMQNFYKVTTFLYAGNSTWVGLLLNSGVVGALGFLLVYFGTIFSLFGSTFRTESIKLLSFGLLGSLLAFAISALTENLLFELYSGFPFWLLVGMAGSLRAVELLGRKDEVQTR